VRGPAGSPPTRLDIFDAELEQIASGHCRDVHVLSGAIARVCGRMMRPGVRRPVESRSGRGVAAERGIEACAAADAELAVDVAEVPLDRLDGEK
jgi:hypothetical protein